MTIRYKCEECGAALNIKDELAGTSGRCPKCKAEFVVPTAADGETGASAHAPAALAAPARSRSASRDDSQKSSASGGPSSGGALSDDDIESILEGKAASGGDAYGVAIPEPDRVPAKPVSPLSTDIPDDDDDDDFARPNARPTPKTPSHEPAVSVASVARDLMARGEKQAKHERGVEEHREHRAGRPFGGDERRDDDDEGFTAREKAVFFLKYVGPVLGVLAVLAAVIWWRVDVWRRGQVPDLAAVSGKVTLDGEPVRNALVQFIPIATDTKKSNDMLFVSAAAGYTDPEGRYTLFYTSVAGAPMGTHLVRIDAQDDQGKQRIPAQYSGTASVIRREVKPGSNTFDFDLSTTEAGPAPTPMRGRRGG